MTIIIPASVTSYVLSKKKYADIYANRLSNLVDKSFRKEVFSIKSFLSGDKSKDKKLYIPINFGRLISSTYADEEVGQGFDVSFGKDETLQTQRDQIRKDYSFDDLMHKVSEKKSAMGYSVVRIRKRKERLVIDRIPIKNYFPITSGLPLGSSYDDIKLHYIMSVVTEGTTSYAYIDEYRMNDDMETWTGTYGKYAYTPILSGVSGLSFSEPIGEVVVEQLEHLPIFVFNNDIINDEDFDDWDERDNKNKEKYNNEYLGESDYADLVDLFQELNDRASQISVEFVKNLTSKLSLPKSVLSSYTMQTKRSEIVKKRAGEEVDQDIPTLETMPPFEYFTHDMGETPAQYVGNPNQYVDKGMIWMTQLIRSMAAISRIPVSYFGIEEKSGNLLDGTMTKMNERFMKKIIAKRNTTTPIMQRMIAYIMYVQGNDYTEPEITRPINTASDFASKVEEYSTLRTAQLVSQRTAVSKVLDIQGEELDAEMQRIQDEQTVIAAINPNLQTF